MRNLREILGGGAEPRARRRFACYICLAVWLGLGAVFASPHINAATRYGEISMGQGLVAVFANMVGPWAIFIIRLVDFPSRDLRVFHLPLALPLALGLSALIFAALWGVVQITRPLVRLGVFVVFLGLMVVWYGVGFFQIAAGLM